MVPMPQGEEEMRAERALRLADTPPHTMNSEWVTHIIWWNLHCMSL